MFLRWILIALLATVVWRYLTGAAKKTKTMPSGSTPGRKPPKDAFAVLGVSQDAKMDEIHAAYQKKMHEYHPDRVAGLGEELRQLAEQRAKEINAAYAQLKRR